MTADQDTSSKMIEAFTDGIGLGTYRVYASTPDAVSFKSDDSDYETRPIIVADVGCSIYCYSFCSAAVANVDGAKPVYEYREATRLNVSWHLTFGEPEQKQKDFKCAKDVELEEAWFGGVSCVGARKTSFTWSFLSDFGVTSFDELTLNTEVVSASWRRAITVVILQASIILSVFLTLAAEAALSTVGFGLREENPITYGAIVVPITAWTIARERHYVDGYGPRPVRDIHSLSGFDVLKLHELQQVATGHQLLGASLLLLLQSWLYDTFFCLEHREEPQGEYSASIWKLPILRYLMNLKLPGIQRFLFLQGLFGAASAKPTHLLFVKAPRDTEDIFRKCQTSLFVPKTVSIGRGSDGAYLMARLKVYPPAFCLAIAKCWWQHILTRQCVFEAEQPDPKIWNALQSMHSELDPDMKGTGHGPDYNSRVAAMMSN